MRAAARRLLLAASSLFALAPACAGKLEDPDRFDQVLAQYVDSGAGSFIRDPGPALAQDAGGGDAPPPCVTELFRETCGVAGCHDEASTALDLVSPGVTGRLVDQSSATELCEGRVFIDSSGAASLLIDKLQPSPPCGSRMPLVGTLSAAQRSCLKDWVGVLGGSVP